MTGLMHVCMHVDMRVLHAFPDAYTHIIPSQQRFTYSTSEGICKHICIQTSCIYVYMYMYTHTSYLRSKDLLVPYLRGSTSQPTMSAYIRTYMHIIILAGNKTSPPTMSALHMYKHTCTHKIILAAKKRRQQTMSAYILTYTYLHIYMHTSQS